MSGVMRWVDGGGDVEPVHAQLSRKDERRFSQASGRLVAQAQLQIQAADLDRQIYNHKIRVIESLGEDAIKAQMKFTLTLEALKQMAPPSGVPRMEYLSDRVTLGICEVFDDAVEDLKR